jgi:hypothetical protein
MSRWDSRTVVASACRAGRAAAGLVVPVMVSWACAVMLVPAFPAVTAASDAHVITNTRNVRILPPRPRAFRPRGRRKKTVINHVRTVADGSFLPGCGRLGVKTGNPGAGTTDRSA